MLVYHEYNSPLDTNPAHIFHSLGCIKASILIGCKKDCMVFIYHVTMAGGGAIG